MPSPASNNLIYLFRVWRANARAAVIREMEFRLNFFSGLFRQILWLGSFILLIEVLFNHTNSLAGWSRIQVITLLALSRIIEGISDTLFNRNIGAIPASIQNGKMDFHLLKPVPTQFQAAFHRFKVLDVGNIAIGFILLAYAVASQPELFTSLRWFLLVILASIGIVIYYSILIAIASLAFWLEKMDAFFAISNLISEPLTAPFDVFPPGLKTALTYLLPLAFIVFVPAQALTGRLNLWQLPLAMAVMIISLLIANLLWRAGLKKYSSASS